MKKNMMISLALATFSFATLSHADILMQSAGADECSGISGVWTGTGTVSNWLIGTCAYHGSAQIQDLDAKGNFMLDMNIDKDSGSVICPNHIGPRLPGNCTNGVVTLKSEHGDLTGNISGNTGTARGTLTLSPGITADVNIKLQKAV